MLAVGAVTVMVTELLSVLVPSLTVTDKTRLRSASPIAIVGAINGGLAVVGSPSPVTAVPES